MTKILIWICNDLYRLTNQKKNRYHFYKLLFRRNVLKYCSEVEDFILTSRHFLSSFYKKKNRFESSVGNARRSNGGLRAASWYKTDCNYLNKQPGSNLINQLDCVNFGEFKRNMQ